MRWGREITGSGRSTGDWRTHRLAHRLQVSGCGVLHSFIARGQENQSALLSRPFAARDRRLEEATTSCFDGGAHLLWGRASTPRPAGSEWRMALRLW